MKIIHTYAHTYMSIHTYTHTYIQSYIREDHTYTCLITYMSSFESEVRTLQRGGLTMEETDDAAR